MPQIFLKSFASQKIQQKLLRKACVLRVASDDTPLVSQDHRLPNWFYLIFHAFNLVDDFAGTAIAASTEARVLAQNPEYRKEDR